MDPAMVTPIRRSLQASAVAALALSGVLVMHLVAVVAFIDGFSSSMDLIGHVVRQLPVVGIYFFVALFGWLLGVAPELPPPPSRVRGALVAGFGIPLLVAIVLVILDVTGVMDLSEGPTTRDDGLKRLSPGLVFMVASAVVGYWLTRRRGQSVNGVVSGQAAA